MSDVAYEPLAKLTKDLKTAAATLSEEEVRYLVDAYYQIQRDRVRASNQADALGRSGEPHDVIKWLGENTRVLESNIRRALDAYSNSRKEGQWARSIVGVGPVISAGLLAHVDVNPWKCAHAPFSKTNRPCRPDAPHGAECKRMVISTAGSVWRFAGLDPTSVWAKGQKRPWNARLKVLAWKLGESFKKTSGHDESIYGKIYRERKALEVERNEAGVFEDQAKQALATRKFSDSETKKKYEAGKLPDGRLDLRAMRYAVKWFLSDYHTICYWIRFHEAPPRPWVITHGGHTHYEPPSISGELEEELRGLSEALTHRRT